MSERPGLGRGLAVGLAAVSLALFAPGAPSALGQVPAGSGDFAGRVEIPGGRQLYLECRGSGWPTVVFEAGLRSRGDIWTWSREGVGTGVASRVSKFTRVCFYDRPGTLAHFPYVSRSDPVPMPRSTGEVVADLHALLAAAGVPGPYVMVGASTGGLIVRQYASLHPAEVSGLVLVDAISEGMQRFMKRGAFARYNAYYLQSPSADALQYKDLEAIDFYRSFAEITPVRRSPRYLPMFVLSANYGFSTPPGVWRRFGELVNRVWKRSQLYLAGLHPRTKRVVAFGSGHQIHVNRPALVARFVLRMVVKARGA
ncbi:MAG TPA: alpha/beta hydrolase [Solirubrobacterales bacterium]|nr:alpha/beta hydrolase [Solirubrobacterales bacterium]